MEDTTKKLADHPIIFFGTEDFSVISLERLVKDGYNIAAVVTKPDMKKGRGHHLIEPIIKTVAKAYQIPVWQPERLKDIIGPIKQLQPVTGVLVSYGRIIPAEIIDLFHPGIINVHPSLLPKYRGPSPIESVILNGDEQTGVTIMQLSAAMDAGPIYTQKTFTFDETLAPESKERISFRLGHIGAGMLSEALPAIISGDLQPISQNDNEATYCQLITKDDGVLDWHKPANRLEREVRAYNGWPGSKAMLGPVTITVTDAGSNTEVYEPGTVHLTSDLLKIGTSKGTLLIYRLKPVGKKEMTAREFINGYGHLFPKEAWA